MGECMKIYYLYNENIRDSLNQRGYDYTPAYIEALLLYMGICAEKISSDKLSCLEKDDILIVGAERIDKIPDCKTVLLGSFVGKDAHASERREKIFANYILGDEKLPLFVPINKQSICGEVIAFAECENEKVPALIKGDGIYEFTFDLAGSVWFSGDGFVSESPSDYFFIGRTPDTRPIKSHSATIPYNDMLLSVLEDILSSFGAFSIFKLPPCKDGSAPDLVINFSGDDDCTSKDFNLEAALTMEEYGFPYHINAMPLEGDFFIMDKSEFDEIRSHGCEFALHTDFTGKVLYSEESQRAQAELFEKTFGVYPYTNTNHCFIQGGSTAERMRRLSACKILADNGKMGEFDPTDINRFDLCGFTFGSSYPRFTCDDHEHKNTLIKSLEIPVNYYEPRLYHEDSDTSKVVKYIENGAENARISQFFIHPHYLALSSSDRPAVLRVLDLIGKTISEKGYSCLYSTTDKITKFWFDRASSSIEQIGNSLNVILSDDMLIVLPKSISSDNLLIDGKKTKVIKKLICGKEIRLIHVSFGNHVITF